MLVRASSIVFVTLFLATSALAWSDGSQNTVLVPGQSRLEADSRQKRREELRAALRAQSGGVQQRLDRPASARDRNALREQLRQQDARRIQQ